MERTMTINADKRYYLDEGLLINGASVLASISRFNDIKIRLYNALYDKRYLHTGPLMDRTYSSWLKENFRTSDYYNCAVYSAAGGQISSQAELGNLYKQTVMADIRTRDKKAASVSGELAKKQAVKNSLRIYAKTGKWQKPYPKCTLKVCGSRISGAGIPLTPVADYERTVEAAIRSLKNRLALIKASAKRASAKLEKLKTMPPKRTIFGTKKLYASKDHEDTDMAQWKEEFHDARHDSMTLPGRHTSKYGNFLVKFKNGDLEVTCMDGTAAIFRSFALSRYDEEFHELFRLSPADRRPVCYNFTVHKDKDGRTYIIPSVTVTLSGQENTDYSAGCIGMDINWDHLALSEVDKDGARMGGVVIPFDINGKSSGQVTEIIGRAVKEAFDYCSRKDKNLVMEDISLTVKRNSLRYGNRKANRHISLFAYKKLMECAKNQSFKRHICIRFIDPAYTSQIGKFRFMRKMGISIHSAASYVIGLTGLGYTDMLFPDKEMQEILKDTEGKDYISMWKKITPAFKGIPVHVFYRKMPYYILKTMKRPSIRTLSSVMKGYAEPGFRAVCCPCSTG